MIRFVPAGPGKSALDEAIEITGAAIDDIRKIKNDRARRLEVGTTMTIEDIRLVQGECLGLRQAIEVLMRAIGPAETVKGVDE